MWLRHAAKSALVLVLLSACSSLSEREVADELNSHSYACHYRSLDSTEHYAQQALDTALHYADGQAEALNNLAFVRIAQMRYEEADQLLERILRICDNQLELLVCYVQQMRLCQRRSQNRAFYDYRGKAQRALHRINEERSQLTPRQLLRLVYAESELAIVTSTYYYYVGLERQAVQALDDIPADLERDTVQLLNYLYYVGSGGMISGGTQDDINQQEFDLLMRCYLLAIQNGIDYYEANSLEALAEHLINPGYRDRLMADNLPAFSYFNTDAAAPDSLPLVLARQSLDLFTRFGDVYQIAGAHRTLASCYLAIDDYECALQHLNLALQDTVINLAPDLVASIREQLSVAYAAVDDKRSSDYNRNLYIDLQEQTRQDRSLEARAGQLEEELAQLNMLLAAVVAAILLLTALIAVSYWRRCRNTSRMLTAEHTDTQLEQLGEQLSMARLRVEKGERLALEQRAKVSLVNGITPLIDRILHDASRIDSLPENERRESLEYISELTDNINEQNDVLTHWIQLRQGQLSLHIETFALQPLFDIVAMGRRSFAMKGIELDVQPSEACVKADRVLTLFMLNTLADNARKFTPKGGRVNIYAEQTDDYVELNVADNGTGMDSEKLARIFDRKIIVDDRSTAHTHSHGFGLLNCKGIIDKYRKLSQIFSVCSLTVESTPGKGSRFAFRLPRGVVRMLLALAVLLSTTVQAQPTDHLSLASIYADSTYFLNVAGDYNRAISFADSSLTHLNAYYTHFGGQVGDTLLRIGDPSLTPPEIIWLHQGVRINFDILLTVRNESAVAALAQHRWNLYQYNNRIYTQLFKEMSADATLDDYCRTMQQSQNNKQVAVVMLLFLLVSILVALAWQGMLSLGKAARRQQEQQDRLELTHDELQRVEQEEAALHVSNAVLDNCLSTLKHETMYYPSRIRQLIDIGETAALPEVVAYYRELYGMLSMQAMRQTEHMRLHLQPLDNDVLGDRVLVGYLFELLRKQAGTKTLDTEYLHKDDNYVVCTVAMPSLRLSSHQAASLFSPSAENIPFLLCRQIVRDHGEATSRRGCAIRAEADGNTTRIIITLPRIWKTSKSSL